MSIARPMAQLAKALLLLLCLTVSAEARDGRWLRAESPSFIVYSGSGERQLRRAVQDLETFDHLLRTLMQTEAPPSPAKLEIYLLRARSELLQVWPDAQQGVAGFYHPGAEQVAAFAVLNSSGGLESQDILFHEYAHHFMAQYATTAYPAWFVEGYAEYVATADIQDERVIVGDYAAGRAYSLVDGGRWFPINEFLAPDREEMSQEETQRFYAQSWLAAHYLFNTPERFDGMRRYFDALRQGEHPVGAFEPAVGVTPQAFHEELRHYARGQLGRLAWRHGPLDAAEIQVTRLPESADDLLLMDARLRREIKPEDRDALVARVIETAGRFPTDAYAMRVRASAELVRGAPAAARALLEPLISADQSDWQSQFLMGASYLNEALEAEGEAGAVAAQARRHFSRAFRANPNHAPTLYNYARTFMFQAPPMAEAPLDVFTKAHLLAPQVSEIGINLAAQLMFAGRHQEAALVLEPFVFSAHKTPSTQIARGLLDAARRGEAPPPYSELQAAAAE